LFLDAGKDTPAPFAFSRLAPKRDATHSTHALSPEAVLDVYVQVRGEAPPPAFALCVRGERFELGEGLSPDGVERLELAWDFVKTLMAEHRSRRGRTGAPIGAAGAHAGRKDALTVRARCFWIAPLSAVIASKAKQSRLSGRRNLEVWIPRT